MMNEFQSWNDDRKELDTLIAWMTDSKRWGNQMADDIIAMEQESDQWCRRIKAMMEKWNQLNADQDESATDEDFHYAPEISPILLVEETESTIEPSSNPNLLLANKMAPKQTWR